MHGPCALPCLLFAAWRWDRPAYLALWRQLDADPAIEEVLRNFPVRQPCCGCETLRAGRARPLLADHAMRGIFRREQQRVVAGAAHHHLIRRRKAAYPSPPAGLAHAQRFRPRKEFRRPLRAHRGQPGENQHAMSPRPRGRTPTARCNLPCCATTPAAPKPFPRTRATSTATAASTGRQPGLRAGSLAGTGPHRHACGGGRATVTVTARLFNPTSRDSLR